MKKPLGDDALNQIFREARTHNAWLDKPVSDEILRQLYDLMKWGPTSANGSPGRLVFLRTPEAKERLRPRWCRETWRRRWLHRSRRSSLTICCFLKSCRS